MGRGTPVRKLSNGQKEEIRTLYAAKTHTQSELAMMFRVAQPTIGRIVDRRQRARKNNRLWMLENPEKAKQIRRRAQMKYQHGITVETYDRMLAEQGGRCAICGQAPPIDKNLDVDHNHQTEENRGLLCRDCNLGLGKFKDRPDLLRAAANYLERLPCQS